MKRKQQQNRAPTKEDIERRESELKALVPPRAAEGNGWERKGRPSWERSEGKGPPKHDGSRSQRNLKTAATIAMANLARSAMAKFGYDGTGLGGAEGYMTMLAHRFPLQFMTDIVAKMIPQNVDATVTNTVDLTLRYESLEETRRELGQMAVPLDMLLDRDDPPLLLEDSNGKGNGSS